MCTALCREGAGGGACAEEDVEVERPLYAGSLGVAVADPLVAHHLLHPGVPRPVEVLGLVPAHWWTEWAPAWGYIPATGAGEEDTL